MWKHSLNYVFLSSPGIGSIRWHLIQCLCSDSWGSHLPLSANCEQDHVFTLMPEIVHKSAPQLDKNQMNEWIKLMKEVTDKRKRHSSLGSISASTCSPMNQFQRGNTLCFFPHSRNLLPAREQRPIWKNISHHNCPAMLLQMGLLTNPSHFWL